MNELMESRAETIDRLQQPGTQGQECLPERCGVSLNRLVDQAIAVARPGAIDRGVALEARHDPHQHLVQTDGERLRRAITHLVINAIRFSQPGRPLIVWTHFSPHHVEIGVRNAGGDVRPDMLPPTPGTPNARSIESVEALGLHMALAKRLVEVQGGRMEVRAAARHGAAASILVRLPAGVATPLAATPPKRAALARASSLPRVDGTHVLLVDDDPDALEFLSLILRAAGARVTSHPYAPPAFAFFVSAAAADRPDVIVSDIAMPIEDGYSFLERIRAWEARNALLPVPAIAVTAFSREEDCLHALLSGFDRHVPKPLDAGKLLETIAQWS